MTSRDARLVPGLNLASKFVALVVVLLLISPPAHAQDVGVKAEAAGLGESLLTGGATGDTASLASVDGVTGAATASLPLALPRNRGRAQPALSLTYNSQRGIGTAGLGWNLNTPSIVQRRLWNAPADGAPAANIFEYDGQPLVPICLVQSNGSCDTSEPQPWAAGWVYYRREVEGGFERFYLSPNGKTWRVLRKNGGVDVFGCLDTFSISGIPSCGALDIDSQALGGAAPMLAAGNYRWNLAASYDLEGGATSPINIVAYEWQHSDNPAEPTWGVGYLSDVFYTPSLNGPPGSPGALPTFAYHVHVSYTADPYVQIQEAPIWKAIPSYLVTGIDITAMPSPSGSTGPRVLLRRYHLNYASSFPDALSRNGTYLPELTSFQMEGRCTSGDIPEDSSYHLPSSTSCTQFPATSMTYAGWNTDPVPISLFNHEGDPGSAFQVSTYSPQNASFMDINGDGLPDMIQPELYDFAAASWDYAHHQRFFVNGAVPSYSPGVDLVSYFMTDPDPGMTSPWPLSGQLLSSGDPYHYADSDINTILLPAGRSFVGDWLANGTSTLLYAPMGNANNGKCSGCVDEAAGFIATPYQTTSGRWDWQYGTPPGSVTAVPPYASAFATGTTYVPSTSIPLDINADGILDTLNITQWKPSNSTTYYAQLRIQLSQRAFPNSVQPFQSQATTYQTTGRNVLNMGSSYIPANYACGYETYADLWDGGLFAIDFANLTVGDLNGDGLPDLFAHGKVVFGNGTNFDCQGVLSGPNNHDGVPIVGGPVEVPFGFSWNDPDLTVWLHDLNADGLADLIIANDAGLSVYMNQGASKRLVGNQMLNGVTFDSSPILSYDPGQIAATLGQAGNSSLWTIETIFGGGPLPSVRIAFADMNGSGTDDLVLVSPNPSDAQHVVYYVEFEHPENPHQRVGLMTSIANGLGASTTIQYQNLGQLAHEASAPWARTSPQTIYVATDVLTKNNVGGDSERDVDTQFSYRDPAYDAWRRQFKGFRDVVSVKQGRRTESTYQIITCQDVPTITSIVSGPNPYPTGKCETNSDLDVLMSLPPLKVAEAVTDVSGATCLTKTNWSYQIGLTPLFRTPDASSKTMQDGVSHEESETRAAAVHAGVQGTNCSSGHRRETADRAGRA